MDKFFEFIKQFTFLSEESNEALSSVLQTMEFSKGYNLLRPGGICQYFYFVELGLTRTYYLKDGKDVTDWFSDAGSFAISIISFLTRQPDIRGIEVLEPSIIRAISYQDLENLYKSHHDIERLGRLLVGYGAVQMQQRFDDLHFATAHQRYKKLISSDASLVNRVPLGMIASYLGISQETLSRIRSRP